jgi:group I intron endonuclease
MGFIYKITCLINNKPYIGLTTRRLEDRWKEHLYKGKKYVIARENMEEVIGNSHLYNAMAAHGIENFTVKIIEEVDDNTLDEREIYWINHYDSINNGYNISFGGRNGHVHTKEIKAIVGKKISEAMHADIENWRRYKDELRGLPIYCIYSVMRNRHYIVVRNHALCDLKYFEIADYSSLDDAKKAVLDFLENLEKSGIKYDPKNDTDGRTSDRFKEKLSKKIKEAKQANPENTRWKHKDKLEGLPPHCGYFEHRGKPAIRVVNHPYCDQRVFTYSKYGSEEATKQAVIAFINDIEARKIKYVSANQNRTIPKGISRYRGGWRARSSIKPDYLEKGFDDKDKTDEENFYAALAALNEFRKNHGRDEIDFDYDDINDEE